MMGEKLVSLYEGPCSSYPVQLFSRTGYCMRFLIMLLSSCKPVKIISSLASSGLPLTFVIFSLLYFFRSPISKVTSFISSVSAAG